MKYFLCLSAVFIALQCFAQTDSIQVKFNPVFAIDRFYQGDDRSIYLPTDIQQQRRQNGNYGLDFDAFTDIPQFHASIYGGLISEVAKGGYHFKVGLIAEDRGQSFGNLSLDKVVVYPLFHGAIQDSIKIGNEKLHITFEGGDLLRYQQLNGLTFNNIDVQGLRSQLRFRKYFFNYQLIADASQHIGLNIQEFYALAFGMNISIANNMLTSTIGIDDYKIQNDSRKFFSFSSVLNTNNSSHYIALSQNIGNLNSNGLALLLRSNNRIVDTKNASFSVDAIYRWYGTNFNRGFYDPTPRYRDPGVPRLNNNSIGNFLYPLTNAHRTFDQWSVYTEYQNQEIHSLSIQAQFKQKVFFDKLFFYCDYEGLAIFPDTYSNAFYNFYQAGFSYTLPLESAFRLFITNKIMNLDVHFQTFYQAIDPVIGFSFSRQAIIKL